MQSIRCNLSDAYTHRPADVPRRTFASGADWVTLEDPEGESIMIWFIGFVVVVNIVAIVLVVIKAKRANEKEIEQYLKRDLSHEDLGTVERGKEPW